MRHPGPGDDDGPHPGPEVYREPSPDTQEQGAIRFIKVDEF